MICYTQVSQVQLLVDSERKELYCSCSKKFSQCINMDVTTGIVICIILTICPMAASNQENFDINEVLSAYETLHVKDLSHTIVKRSIDNTEIKQVQFATLDRDFHLYLQKSREVLAPGFRVLAVDKHNKKRPVKSLDINMYKGHLADEEDTSVEAYFESGVNGEENLVATIRTKDDVYIIEPSWRHLPGSDDYSMISYKASNMKMKDHLGPSYCGFVRPDGDAAAFTGDKDEDHENEEPSERYRRQSTNTPRKNTCPLLLVADYRFYRDMGQASLSKTTTYLINLIQRVNKIYTTTEFGNFKSMGFGIKEIHIHEEWSVVSANEEHYNMERDSWPTKYLLELFSRNPAFRGYCLAHLFTHQPFDGGVLGLAYIAAPREYSVGGICTQAYYKDGSQLFLNTGWSSSLNRYERRLLTQEADLVTTHEFGHNWGSEHDPDTSECAPNSFKGGKHVMYTYSVSGYDPNNEKFSPCSRRSIAAVLQAKSQKCFSEPMKSYCGNALVEENEECDPGPQSIAVDGDKCCDGKCQLKSNSDCSDSNDVCCENCKIASANIECHQAQNGSCEDRSLCNGQSKVCPTPPHKSNGSECIGRGTCQAGQCISYCESNDKMSCACDNVTTSCKWCCRNNDNSTCKPVDINNPEFNLPDGMPCVVGFCEKGVCKKQVQDLVQRFWNIIELLGPNTIVAFMRANIVGTVIILSLFLWIPASCIVWKLDKKRELEDRREIAWLSASNNTLVNPNDVNRVKRTTRVQPRRRDLTTSVIREPIVRPGQPANINSYQPPGYRYIVPKNQPTTSV